MPDHRKRRQHRILQRVSETELVEGREQLEKRLKEHIKGRDAALEHEAHWQEARWELEPLAALAWLWDQTWLLNGAGRRWHDLAEWSRAEMPSPANDAGKADASEGREARHDG